LFFRRVVKASFGQRRKTLWNCLKTLNLESGDDEPAKALEECGIAPERRGETLSLDEFAQRAKALFPLHRGGKVLE
jgi:16S rRNA (adenine1518-N6/adenine1519-N6)-dimethyltransferase